MTIWKSYAIFSLGDLQGTSSSNSSSLSSGSWGILSEELVNMSGTGKILGLREFLRWFIISGLSKFGLSPVRGISKWLPVTPLTSTGESFVVVSPKHCFESQSPLLSGNTAVTQTKDLKEITFAQRLYWFSF